MAQLDIIVQLNGTSFVFNDTNTDNIASVIDEFGTVPCPFTVEYNGTIYEGDAMRVGDEIIATFDDEVILPTGMCLIFECPDATEDEDDCQDFEVPYDNDLRIRVVDADGCDLGWILMSDMFPEDLGPFTLCELLGITEVPEGNLLASDRLLVINDNCELKSVDISEIVCP